jgi:hypothetical protein
MSGTPYPLDIRTQSGSDYVYPTATADPPTPIVEPLTIADGTTIEVTDFGGENGQNYEVRLTNGTTQLVIPIPA